MRAPYRLGLDLGTNSIGWTMVDLDEERKPVGIRRMGSRIFSDGRDPKSGNTLAADRTSIRSARTRRDRALRRRNSLLATLRRLGLLPDDIELARKLATRDPYQDRADAAQKAVHPYHLGRALLHLSKRRGFQSNRRTPVKDSDGNTEAGKQRLRELLSGRTLGQFLLDQIARGVGARFRPSPESTGKAKKEFPLYPERDMYRAEFDAIRTAQHSHQKLFGADWDELRRIIFHQRPLKTPERGRCRFLPAEPRAFVALPSFQQFRLLSDANHLGYRVDPFGPVQALSAEQRAEVLALTRKQKTVGFDKLRTKLRLPDTAKFNLESDKRDKLVGDTVAALFASKNLFGARWEPLPLADRDAIVTAVLVVEEHDQLRREGQRFGLEGTALDAFCELTPDDLPKGTARFSAPALHRLVPHLEKGLNYSDAVAACGWQHTLAVEDGSAATLPYYGKAMPDSVVPAPKSKVAEERDHGRFPNPTVHIALNQLRVVVNALIARYGKPAEINLEIARDLKMSARQREELLKDQAANTKKNAARDAIIDEINREHGAKLSNNYENRLRIRLWEELNQSDVNARLCPYTGERISRAKLFTDTYEIDHILPFAATLDDSPANKILCVRDANRDKRKRSPYEAFGHNPGAYDYGEILLRAAALPGNKRWRFQADAMTKFRDEEGFRVRQLVDTQHLGRAAHRYLTCIAPPDRIRVSPGRITALLRHHWGLETLLAPADAPDRTGKNRADHRHHAIDALVVALLDHRLLHFIRSANAAEDLDGIEVPPPWKSLRADAAARVEEIVVSHRPDHNPAGRLHEAYAYGEVLQDRARRRPGQQWEIDAGYNLVIRKPVTGLKSADIERVRDLTLRQKLAATVTGVSDTAKTEWANALARFSNATGAKTLRLVVKDETARRISHGENRFTKAMIPGLIHSVTFWQTCNGSVEATFLSVWDANNSPPPLKRPHPTAIKLFTLHKDDVVRLLHDGAEMTARVVKFEPSKGNRRMVCCGLRDADSKISAVFIKFSSILKKNVRLIHVSPIGDVRDPGPLA